MRFWRKPAPPLKPRACETADIAALDRAIKILDRASSDLVQTAAFSFVYHAERYLRDQREEAFRYLIGRDQ